LLALRAQRCGVVPCRSAEQLGPSIHRPLAIERANRSIAAAALRVLRTCSRFSRLRITSTWPAASDHHDCRAVRMNELHRFAYVVSADRMNHEPIRPAEASEGHVVAHHVDVMHQGAIERRWEFRVVALPCGANVVFVPCRGDKSRLDAGIQNRRIAGLAPCGGSPTRGNQVAGFIDQGPAGFQVQRRFFDRSFGRFSFERVANGSAYCVNDGTDFAGPAVLIVQRVLGEAKPPAEIGRIQSIARTVPLNCLASSTAASSPPCIAPDRGMNVRCVLKADQL